MVNYKVFFIRSVGEDSVTCSGDESRFETFKYLRAGYNLSRKAESADEISDVRTDCAEFKPVGDACWGVDEAGSPVTCSGEEVTGVVFKP